jgi:DNA mismatch repair protein MutS
MKITPMMKQYRRIKKENDDAILLFRLGDFYEMFEKDAQLASRVLNITLTKRNSIPMCGFPYHAAQNYIAKLLGEGLKIAICEQSEDPNQTKTIVKREVVEIISPGIITDPGLLPNKSANGIAALYGSESRGMVRLACASLDVSTGEFVSSMIGGGDVIDDILNEIENNGIREIIYPESFNDDRGLKFLLDKVESNTTDIVCRAQDDYLFNLQDAEAFLEKHYSVTSSDVFELGDELEVAACGALLLYVTHNIKHDLSHIQWIRGRRKENALIIDNATKRHLELTRNVDGKLDGTLIDILDKTQTAMGGRLLKKSINSPFNDIIAINDRLIKVSFFYEDQNLRTEVRSHLSRILDIERIVSKLSVAKGNGRDLIGLKNSLQALGRIKSSLEAYRIFRDETEMMTQFEDIIEIIQKGIDDSPPMSVKEGRIIKAGYDSKLDELRKGNKENRDWINRYQLEEGRKHGIGSLKVKYNRIIGYYIEVTKPNLHLVPQYYLKKQTLVNSERFTTEELERHETLLMEARTRADTLEFEIFEKIRNTILGFTAPLYSASEAIASIDLYCSLSLAARENGYVMPVMVEDNIIDIKDGRHPVVEILGEEEFIENDLNLNDSDRRIMILTGPNMAGKSTYLRQAALIIIMAHLGSFVPAQEAKIGIVDRVFSRIGASDRIVKGESTFLVEMIETSRILHYATERSFIIMDEIGRGTSTYDGLSIAWAVLEYLLDSKPVGAKVLFATHYHEITALNDRRGIINCNVKVREWNNSVIFLRKIEPGSASKSYGIEVARMAGIPDWVVERAKSILGTLEMKYGGHIPLVIGEEERKPQKDVHEEMDEGGSESTHGDDVQLGLFPSPYEILIKELKRIDINRITPLEALSILEKLKKSI